MKRREFFKLSALSLGAFYVSPSLLFASNSDVRTFHVKYFFDMSHHHINNSVNVWSPIPCNSDYQTIKFFKFNGTYSDYNINSQNLYDARTFYATWDKRTKKRILEIEFVVQTKYRRIPIRLIKEASEKNLPIPEEIKLYLKPTKHIPTSGKIKKLVYKLTSKLNDRFEKVQAIYDWVTKNTFRDPKVKGCGLGDVEKMLETGYLGGKCTDISSIFVSLLRTAGIPAREVFGIRLGKSYFSNALGKSDSKGFADITTWQHCRAEYYIPGIGWIPADPADVTKLELVEKLPYNSPRTQELKRRYLHSWEMNWMAFNWARDFDLYPLPVHHPINNFGYPYGEVDGTALDYYNPKKFIYKITSQEL